MMRAGGFRHYVAPTLDDATKALADEPSSMLIAGGTDVVPGLKRRQREPALLVSLRRLSELHTIDAQSIGAGATLAALGRRPEVREQHRALHRAVTQIASPLIRNTATIGGNLCLDTRCNFYDQTHEWRKSIGFCKKAPPPGETEGVCWVAPSSSRCWAVSSTDAAPALIALGARISLHSVEGEREIALEELYADDGIHSLTRRRDEILTRVHLPRSFPRSTYWKLRRRGSIDFPALGVAAAIRLHGSGVVEEARVVLGAVSSRPLLLAETSMLVGSALTDDAIEAFAEAAAVHAKPLDNTDFAMTWRKSVARTFLAGVLRELRGDDPATFPLLARSCCGAA